MDKKKMGERLREARHELGETQEMAAKAAGITPSSYAMYEGGNRIPRDDVKIALAKHFNKTVLDLFF